MGLFKFSLFDDGDDVWFTRLYCGLMTLIDVRLWFCKCKYESPYGRMCHMDCARHYPDERYTSYFSTE